MTDDDIGVALLDALTRANPVPTDELGGRRDLPSAHALFAEITAQRPRRVRRRTVIVAVALVVLALAALLGAFALVHHDEPTVVGSVECAPTAKYPIMHGSVAPSGGDPIAACAALWHDGTFGTGGPSNGLDACVLPGGAVGVFPGEYGSVCPGLGLPPAQSSPSVDKLERFENDTSEAVRENCVGYDDAHAIVEGELAKYGYAGWTIELRPGAVPYSAENPCSSMYFEPDSRAAFIVPTTPAYPGQPVPTAAG